MKNYSQWCKYHGNKRKMTWYNSSIIPSYIRFYIDDINYDINKVMVDKNIK